MVKTRLYQIFITLSLAAFLLSACGGGSAANNNKVEVFSWWTDGNQAAGLTALTTLFLEQYPKLEFVNAATGSETARAVLASRLRAGEWPDSWQGHGGQELIGTYAVDEENQQIVPLNDLYKEQGWLDVVPKMLIPWISQDGNIYSLPISVYRTNLLWYNPAILEENDITAPRTLSEWFTAMDALQAAGVTPLALGDASSRMHLLDSILLSTLGPQKYFDLWDGSLDWSSVDITTALQNYEKALSYAESESSSDSWQDTAQLIAGGEAAYFVMGDWVEPYFRGLEKKADTDYAWVPVPGTDGIFQFTTDSFVLAAKAPNRDGVISWLKVAGSKEGQEAFNQANGSICARTDCDASLFEEYARSAMGDWSSAILVGSLVYGVVANEEWQADIDTALTGYIKDGDLAAFQSALADACTNSGACKQDNQETNP